MFCILRFGDTWGHLRAVLGKCDIFFTEVELEIDILSSKL